MGAVWRMDWEKVKWGIESAIWADVVLESNDVLK